MTIDKQNGSVAYNDEAHSYWNVNDNEKYISVTTLIHQYQQPFDDDFWSSYKALERLLPKDIWMIEKKSLNKTKQFSMDILDANGIKVNDFNREKQNILDEWEKKKVESCERGTKIHAALEQSMYKAGNNISLVKRYGVGGKFECRKDYLPLDLECGVYPEYLISYTSDDGLLRVAGQIDLLIKNGNEIYIADYKGLPLDTEIPTVNGWSTIAELKEGDYIFDKNGNPTKILHKSKIHLNPCYKITFDDGNSIIADHEHRWEISFRRTKTKKNPTGYIQVVMTTEELFDYLNSLSERKSELIPKILNAKPLQLPEKDLPIDPYVLGAWLGDGSKNAGNLTQAKDSKLWDEIRRRGYEVGENGQHDPDRTNVETRTVYGLRTQLRLLGILTEKHIPDMYQRASYEQRLDLLRGLMDTDGYYNDTRKRFVMSTGQEWQRDDMVKLLSSLGCKVSVFNIKKKCNEKEFQAWDICFSTSEFNPFLIRNQEIDLNALQTDKRSFRNINKIELVPIIQTQCLEVDSPTHTFLCTKDMIVTHNTNEKIEQKSFYDSSKKSSQKMLYPLNNLDDVNYWHYNMQLSTYAWMIQQKNPDFIIKDLIMIHFDHKGNETPYHLDYLKNEVERMFAHYKQQLIHQKLINSRKRIEY